MKRDHAKLICDISELTALFTDTSDLDGFLMNIVQMVSVHMKADVCSIYLYEEQSDELVLRATRGLAASSIGKIRLKSGEGLTGAAFKELRAICEGDVGNNPRFKSFAGIGEEKYSSFLVVPILRGHTRIGAMTLQAEKKNYFTPEDVNVFRAITSQMATTIEMAKLLYALPRSAESVRPVDGQALKFIKGRVGAQGFAYGEVYISRAVSWEEFVAQSSDTPGTVEDLLAAAIATEKELKALQHQIEEKLFDVASLIFTAQILMLKDRSFLGAMEELVRRDGVHPAEAVRAVVREYAGRFARMSNEYLRDKQFDVMDVGRRLLSHLVGKNDFIDQAKGKVVIARDLLPSEALKLSTQGVAGIVLLSGGVTSHVAVLARSLNIPLVIADEPRLLDLSSTAHVLLDAAMGNIFIDPEKEVLEKFREQMDLHAAAQHTRADLTDETFMKGGAQVHLFANINLLGDAAVAREYHAEGVGLYRTEFPFIVRSDFPAEEEQYVIYRKLIEMMEGREVTFRTLDIGGDKMLSYYDHSREANPFLGLRSIRFSLTHKEIFSQQLRAILRAAADAKGVRIMFPMISSLDEFLKAKAVVLSCSQALKQEGIRHAASLPLGVMVEIPSIVEVVDDMACEADFFSIGTNDLIQYTLAVDRTNEKVADLYIPHHPAVLRALKKAVDAALGHGRDISVCGDMAHDVRYLPFLTGIGLRKFSLDARYIPKAQTRLKVLDVSAAQAHAKMLLKMTRIEDIEQELGRMEAV